MRAIDLYAGIGGWSLGLRLASIEVVQSYEYWQPAIDTHTLNHGKKFEAQDIRALDLSSLPADIDIVVGSPPCTEFSYSNRGGKGNLAEGMKDLRRFFEIVAHLKPKFWAMENVPRVAKVLEAGFSDESHPLYEFRNLGHAVRVINFGEYGAPQARKRCIATNIPFDLIDSYREKLPQRNLRDVLEAFAAPEGTIEDPIWGCELAADQLTETEIEPLLNAEELRMNREAKEFHPVYNNMAFPEPLDQPSRTVTATCTRVSRESLVVFDEKRAGFRRLTIRERASLQGFPITYQFSAKSFAEKAKMVGNAIPPTFPYLLAMAALETKSDAFTPFKEKAAALKLPGELGKSTPPDKEGRTYPITRKFRAALPHLRFKSGMRFELANSHVGSNVSWAIKFYFGSSKDIREVELDGSITKDLEANSEVYSLIQSKQVHLAELESKILLTTPTDLQQVWAHKRKGFGPYDLVDYLGEIAGELISEIEERLAPDEIGSLEEFVLAVAATDGDTEKVPGRSKLRKYAIPVVAGFIVGDWFNTLDWYFQQKEAA